MKKLLFILLISTSLFAQFRSYDTPEFKTIEDLNTGQLQIAIDRFAEGKSVTNIVGQYSVRRSLVTQIFSGIHAIENYAFKCMAGTAIVGVAKVTRTQDLIAMVNLKFPKYIDINVYLLTKMIEYSKKDGSGNWAFYKSQFGE